MVVCKSIYTNENNISFLKISLLKQHLRQTPNTNIPHRRRRRHQTMLRRTPLKLRLSCTSQIPHTTLKTSIIIPITPPFTAAATNTLPLFLFLLFVHNFNISTYGFTIYFMDGGYCAHGHLLFSTTAHTVFLVVVLGFGVPQWSEDGLAYWLWL